MKPIPNLEQLLTKAVERNIFGTKMRSVIKEANPQGIRTIVEQQFEVGKQILAKGLIPIIEPEVDINSSDKQQSEVILKEEILKQLETLEDGVQVIVKITIPTENNFYDDLISNPHILRVVALSGGYSKADAIDKLAKNKGLIASFSRALSEGLLVNQSDIEFETDLSNSIQEIYKASIT
jgi:fructose-bisphosphate aldolase class I